MPLPLIICVAAAVIISLGVAVFPAINRHQLKNMPYDQQIRIIMKGANKLHYFKNITNGTKGTLIYVKNKRKILSYPWVLVDGKMICTKANPFDKWDYPEEQPPLTEDEIKLAIAELEKYNKHCAVKLYLQENDKNDITQ